MPGVVSAAGLVGLRLKIKARTILVNFSVVAASAFSNSLTISYLMVLGSGTVKKRLLKLTSN